VTKYTQSGFCGTIEAVRNLVKTENEEFSQSVAGVSEDYHLREEFQKFVVPDFLSRSHEERSSCIRKLSLATMEDLHAADGPESFGWAAGTGCEKSKPTSRDVIGCHTEMLSRDVDGFDCLYEDPRLETILSASREAMVKKARLLLDTNGVWRGPPTSDGKATFSVSSISHERPNYVVIDKNTGCVECECTNCKSLKMCSHALAVAEREDILHEYFDFYAKQPMSKKSNLTKVSNIHVNVGPLGKKGRCVRNIPRQDHRIQLQSRRAVKSPLFYLMVNTIRDGFPNQGIPVLWVQLCNPSAWSRPTTPR